MKSSLKTIFGALPLLFFLSFYTATVFGIDNPDAPDYKNEFLTQANKYEEQIAQGNYGTQEYIQAYAEYEEFLDKELNIAYRLLQEHLNKDSQAALKNSQHKWLSYRDAEFGFIALNWNKDNFGSSSAISAGGYRTAIIKNRVISLFDYVKNYTP